MSAQPTKPPTPLTPSEKSQFTTLYLQRATQEFAEDLDQVRGRDDFKDDALSMLIEALKQGTATYSDEEKRKVVGGARKAEGKGVNRGEKGEGMEVDEEEGER